MGPLCLEIDCLKDALMRGADTKKYAIDQKFEIRKSTYRELLMELPCQNYRLSDEFEAESLHGEL